MVEKREDGIGSHYSFATEYKGPPLPFDIPRAVPIDVSKIPVAVAAAAPVSYQRRDGLCLPVVKPLFAQTVQVNSTVINQCSEVAEPEAATVTNVSPTSVIERANSEDLMSGDLSTSGPFRSSGTLDPGSSSQLRLSEDLSRDDWASTDSASSSDYGSSLKEKTLNQDFEPPEGKRGSIVSFLTAESDEDSGLGIDVDEIEENDRIKSCGSKIEEATRQGKKWSCCRCGKGNRFTEKEACIVCDAKHCSNCILRSMGSMPEGRKCVSCIGFPIDESKRGNLGKSSRMLKKLLNDLEVRQIMKAEKHCEANQLRPEHVYVNGSPLSHEELTILQTCPNPPKKLKPENYWYDKVSGLWGKEGQKPSQIISHHLNVGPPIRPDASNGNTKVFINGREITKVEVRMLQLAGVQCAGFPHFWVNEDGSYLEEGQKNPKGYIWGKAGMKLVCALLSLPIPSKNVDSGEQVSNTICRNFPEYLERRSLLNLLLVGNRGSGTSTIFKQAKLLYKQVPFTDEEREEIKHRILSNLYGYLGILLEGRERFEEESSSSSNATNAYSLGQRLKSFSDWMLKTMASGSLEAVFPAATREYAPLVEELWMDPAIQATYSRRSELESLPDVACYYLERVVDILKVDYEPSDMDILFAERVTSSNGLACLDFSFPLSPLEDNYDSDNQHEALLRYQLIRVQARALRENCKMLEMFEDAGMVIFCVALTEYDEFSGDVNGGRANSMILSKQFFESVVTHPSFDRLCCLLLLTKYDIFEKKVESVPLTRCEWFGDFNPVVSRNRSSFSAGSINSSPSLGQVGYHYIAVKFKKLYAALTGRKLFVSAVNGVEAGSVDGALKYAREIVKWDDERHDFSQPDVLFYSTEGGSSSP